MSDAKRRTGGEVSLVNGDGGDRRTKAQPIKTLGRAKAFSDAGQGKPTSNGGVVHVTDERARPLRLRGTA
jgi:hypothetical protein